MPFFSICVPNFNYQNFLKITLDSVTAQTEPDLEVVVSDNASTDRSVEIVRECQIKDSRISLCINRCNVGFAGNLGKAAAMASGQIMIMLSSDDLMTPSALKTYKRLFEFLGNDAAKSIVNSSISVIDSSGNIIGQQGVDWKLWKGAVQDTELSSILGAPVYSIESKVLLSNSLRLMRVPFYFLSTAYPKILHDAVEGYSQGGLFNPDKRFAWEILARAERAYMIDSPLFQYRVHGHNQAAIQASTGTLKHLVDEYVATFSVNDIVLEHAQVDRHEMSAAFVEQDIVLRGFKRLAEGDRQLARRMVHFGSACYPNLVRRNKKALMLRIALTFGPLGSLAARLAMGPAQRRWEKKVSTNLATGGAGR